MAVEPNWRELFCSPFPAVAALVSLHHVVMTVKTTHVPGSRNRWSSQRMFPESVFGSSLSHIEDLRHFCYIILVLDCSEIYIYNLERGNVASDEVLSAC